MNVQEAGLTTEAATTDIAAEIADSGGILCGFAVADTCVSGGSGVRE